MSRLFVVVVLVLLTVAIGATWAFARPSAEPQGVQVVGSGSYLRIGSMMGVVTETHPAPDTYCYSWASGEACFQVAPNTGIPSFTKTP
jgi:hypothetical protein